MRAAAGDVHADLRRRPGRRLECQHPGAGRRQQDHPTVRPLYGTAAAPAGPGRLTEARGGPGGAAMYGRAWQDAGMYRGAGK
ncbi:hypothetical protein SCOCK_480048 [Actinacidiphila cocklensis]|uniref:Uncharacterized protein n=1 Tax=Actinacidiphila cocklensis TaxID=887465 RepID=A0A9W4GU25_9ACTN|nr:hypothetical protein SCOCK_480048 [Actinacidiphila cocklensis]